jgi:3-hydroxyanthranilate 3,4-dioxygenase
MTLPGALHSKFKIQHSKLRNMAVQRPFNLQGWIDQNRHLLKPPVGNQQVYKGNDDFIVMVVGGPNSRKDFHIDDGEELFYQLEGEIVVKIVEDGQIVDIPLKAGDLFLLPPGVPHSPRRSAGSVGLVVERYRKPGEKDGFVWYCENCGNKLYEEFVPVSDIVQQLPVVMNNFFDSLEKRTCTRCGTVMEKPVAK